MPEHGGAGYRCGLLGSTWNSPRVARLQPYSFSRCCAPSTVMSEDKPLLPISQLLRPAPCSVGAFPRPWLGASRAAFSHQHSWNHKLAGHSGLALQRLETFLCPTVSTAVAASHTTSGMKQQCHFLLSSPCVVWELDSFRQFSLGMSRGCRRSWWSHRQGVLTTFTHPLAGVGNRLGSQQTP